MGEEFLKTLAEMDDEYLVNLMCEMQGRSLMYESELQHNRYWTLRREVMRRLRSRSDG